MQHSTFSALETAAQWATVLNAGSTFLLALSALLVSIGIWRLTKVSQQHNVVLQCNIRYDNLIQAKYRNSDGARNDEYWERFWVLQQDQYNHWRYDLIPDVIFVQWQRQRHLDWYSKALGAEYQAQWNKFSSGLDGRQDFIAFTDIIHSVGWKPETMMKYKKKSTSARSSDA